MKKPVPISEVRLENANQSWYYTRDHKYRGELLRVEIRVNHYDFQSYTRVLIFDVVNRKWNHLTSLPYSQASSSKIGCYWPEERVREKLIYFTQDEQRLLFESQKLVDVFANVPS